MKKLYGEYFLYATRECKKYTHIGTKKIGIKTYKSKFDEHHSNCLLD